jgi:hypothetical protein
MKPTAQLYISSLTTKAAADLITAVEALPEENRNWNPLDKGRSAVDQAAECAILNGFTVQLLESHAFPSDFSYEVFTANKEALAASWDAVKAELEANTAAVVAAIETVSDDDMAIEIDMPWGRHTLGQIMAYPYWNMSYHEGQINYISTLL